MTMTPEKEAEIRSALRELLERGERVGMAVVTVLDKYQWQTIDEQKSVVVDIAVQEAQAVERSRHRRERD